jgi:hypothetical protein
MKSVAINYPVRFGKREINLYYHENSFWLTLNSLSEFFNCSVSKVYISIKELKLNSKRYNKHLTVKLKNGKKTVGNFFSLEIVIALAYKLNPKKAIELYKWSLSAYRGFLSTQTKSSNSLVKKLFKH